MGAGKTSVLAEASDILTLRRLAHAAIDMDALGLGHLPSGSPTDEVMYDNLRSVFQNYAALGVQRFLVARALEGRTQLEQCRGCLPGANTLVCRLTAGIDEMRRRVAKREGGMLQQEFVARVAKLNAVLDAARLEDFTVSNENRSLSDVALEMLVKAGWISN